MLKDDKPCSRLPLSELNFPKAEGFLQKPRLTALLFATRRRSNGFSFAHMEVFTVTPMTHDCTNIIGIRTVVPAVFLCGWNLTSALFVSAFVLALYICDVIHCPSHSPHVPTKSPRGMSPAHPALLLGRASLKNCFNMVCTPAILSFKACASA